MDSKHLQSLMDMQWHFESRNHLVLVVLTSNWSVLTEVEILVKYQFRTRRCDDQSYFSKFLDIIECFRSRPFFINQ